MRGAGSVVCLGRRSNVGGKQAAVIFCVDNYCVVTWLDDEVSCFKLDNIA